MEWFIHRMWVIYYASHASRLYAECMLLAVAFGVVHSMIYDSCGRNWYRLRVWSKARRLDNDPVEVTRMMIEDEKLPTIYRETLRGIMQQADKNALARAVAEENR